MKNYFIYTLFALSLFFVTFTAGSCRKKADTIAKVIVKNAEDKLVSGARVVLQGKSTTEPIQPVVRKDTAMTNSSGVATFNYNDVYQLGQAGFAVLDILVSKGDLKGKGVIKIEEEVENTATVFIDS